MYTYVILLMCCIVSSAFFVVKQKPVNGSIQYFCVTNSSSPISWIDRNNKETYQQASEFIPKKNNNNLFWNLESSLPEKYWSIENSLNGNISQVILDRRWENMTIEKTHELTDFGEKLKFLPVLRGLKRNFVIPFSVKAENAHMFLCDGADVWQYNCYWFLLQVPTWPSLLKLTAIRKCMSESLSQMEGDKVKLRCAKNLRRILHTLEEPEYLNKNRWRHFTLEKKGNVLFFSQVKESGEKEILSFSESNILNVTHMIIHTKYYPRNKVKNGLWKIHQLNYMYTNNIMDKIRLGPILTTFNNSICISMFVTMCSSCELNLTISKNEDPKQILFQRKYTEKRKWAEIKLFQDNINSNEVILLVSTINKDHTRGFWALDSIRQCQKDEFRVISSPQRKECQLVSYNEDILLYQNQSEVKTNCPEDTISQYCVPCSWFSNNCDQFSVYEKVCPEGKYGASCSHICRNKCHTCNKLDGTCNPKTAVFVTIPPSIPILDDNARILPSNQTETAKMFADALKVPHDLHTEWTSENNLKLNWKYSSVTIQNIQYFIIEAIPYNHCSKRFSHLLSVSNNNNFLFFYEIQAINLCSSTDYSIKIRAYYNRYYGPEITINVTSPPSIPILDDNPRVFTFNQTAILKIFASKLLRNSSLSSCKMFVLITDEENVNTSISQELQNLTQIDLDKYRMVFECHVTDALNISELTIGDNSTVNGCLNHPNPALHFRTSYNISIILTNTYEDRTSYKEYVVSFQTGKIVDKSSNRYESRTLMIIVPITIIINIILIFLWSSGRVNSRTTKTKHGYQINENETQLMYLL